MNLELLYRVRMILHAKAYSDRLSAAEQHTCWNVISHLSNPSHITAYMNDLALQHILKAGA